MISRLQSQEFYASGVWPVPAGVSAVWVSAVGAGGGGRGGGSLNGQGGGGGGSGEFCISMPYKVTPGGMVPVVIGVGGLGGATAADGGEGTATSFGTLLCAGGFGGYVVGANHYSGPGGGVGGAGVAFPSSTGRPVADSGEVRCARYCGGSAGGSVGNGGGGNGGTGGRCNGINGALGGATDGVYSGGGGGGAASFIGTGGVGGAGFNYSSAGLPGFDAPSPGAGGGGGGCAGSGGRGGNGGNGYVRVEWIAVV